jgi:hypothetical protein
MPGLIPPPRAGVTEGSRIRIVGGNYGGCSGTFHRTVGRGIRSLVSIDDDTRAHRQLQTRFIFPETPHLAHQARLALLHRILDESRTIEERLMVLTADARTITSYLSEVLEEWPQH